MKSTYLFKTKWLIFLGLLAISVIIYSLPKKSEATPLVFSGYKKDFKWINDSERLFSDSTEKIFTELITEHESKTTNEIAIITIANFNPYANIDEYSLATANKLGIGKKGKDNGVLIVVSKTQRRIRISTGYGIESKLTDELCQQIIQNNIIPEFKKDDYETGVFEGLKEIIRILESS